MAVDLQVHKFKRVETAAGKRERRLSEFKPYIRLSQGSGRTCFMQGGLIMSESGPALAEDEISDWIWEELAKCSEEALQTVGFQGSIEGKRLTPDAEVEQADAQDAQRAELGGQEEAADAPRGNPKRRSKRPAPTEASG